MKKQILNRFAFVIAIALIAGVFSVPSSWIAQIAGSDSSIVQRLENFKITLGLDLAGGTELDYKIDLTDALTQNNDDDPTNDVSINDISESVRDSLERRVNPAGIGEIIVKRSQINNEEHILIQMPPSSNVEQAKSDAEKDNRLEFYAEDPGAIVGKRLEIAEWLTTDINAENWEQKAPEYVVQRGALLESFGPVFLDEMEDAELGKKLATLAPGEVLQEIVDTTIQPSFTVNESGELTIEGSPFPRNMLGIARLTAVTEEDKESTTPAKATARHILIAHPEAMRAPEELPYASKEEAQAKAEEILQQIKDGADFAELAKEFSTGPSAESGGDLGEFEPGSMVGPFNDAVFALETPQLIEEVIETDFGFHIIDVQAVQKELTAVQPTKKVTYELLSWNKDDITWSETELGGGQLEIARVGYDQVGSPLVDLRFDSEGGRLFAQITEQLAAQQCNNTNCRLGIKVGGEWISLPYVSEKISGRNAQITGSFTYEEAKELSDGLNLGAIDAPVILSGQTTIQAELGADQLNKSIKAAVLGLAATILFMILIYRIPGIVAAIALLLYSALFITLLKVWPTSLGGPIVLTLAGAAGIALSIGLAVDGNILIFERLKEELRRGRTLSQAIDLGFERAWTAIRDSNLTTLITCIILFSLGSSVVKGFAITLIVGTLLSMFTAVTISRNLLRLLILIPGMQNPNLFGVSESSINHKKKTVGAKVRKRKK